MINIFTGIMGSGKTLYAVEIILNNLAQGRIVATNIQLDLKNTRRYILKKFGIVIDRKQYIFLSGEREMLQPHLYLPKGTPESPNLLILDECAFLFPAREWQKTQKDFHHYLLMLRRQHHEVFLICQRINQIDKQFRDLYQYRFHFNNLSRALHLPVLGRFPWQVIIRIQYDQTNQRLSWKPYLIDLKVASCYNTYQEIISFNTPKINIKTRKRGLYAQMGRCISYYGFRFKKLFYKNRRTFKRREKVC